MATLGLFKNAIKPNINNTWTEVYKAPANMTSYIIECDVACVGDTGVQISVRIKAANGDVAHVVKAAPVPVGSAIQVIDGQKIVLQPGDALEIKCETPSNVVDAIVSLVEDVNS